MTDDEKEIKDFVDQRMQEELSIKNPAGIIPPKKQVRLIIGEGDAKFEIGVAELETMPDGSTKVEITLTEEKYAQALGTGVKLTGVIPAPDPSDLHKFEQYKEEWFLPRDREGE